MGRMTARAFFNLVAFCLFFTAPAFAQDAGDSGDEEEFRPRIEFMPFAGYRTGGSFDYEGGIAASQTLEIRDDSSWGLDIGLYRDRSSFYELLYSQQNAALDTRGTSLGSLQLRTEYLQVGGTLLFKDENWFVPFLSMTAGVTKFEPDGGSLTSETEFSFSLGGGLRLPVNEHFSVLIGVRGYVTFIDPSSVLFCAGAGSLNCAFRITGDTFFQAEGQLGLSVTF
jgi:hypothetical protein